MTTRTRHLIREEEAVSPVIGVILMVAITVILAAVIGAFVFGMGGSLSSTYTVGVTATQTSGTAIDVTFQGGPDANLVKCMNASIDGTAFTSATVNAAVADDVTAGPEAAFGDARSAVSSTVPVGTAVTLTDADNTVISTGRDHLVVTATFLDGTQQIVLDTYV